MPELTSDILLLLGASLYVTLVVQVPVLLKRRGHVSKRTAREIVHALAGLSVLTLPHFRSLAFPLSLALAGVALTFLSRPNSPIRLLRDLYDAIGEPAEDRVGYLQGPFHYSLAITVLVAGFAVFAPDKLGLAIGATLLMIISDPLASGIGRRWGKIKWPTPWTGSHRTVLGSTVFLLSAFLVCLAYLSGSSHMTSLDGLLRPGDVLVYSVTAAGAGTIIELLSPSKYDDLTVPIGSAAAMVFVGLV